jgi:hypothetical protein
MVPRNPELRMAAGEDQQQFTLHDGRPSLCSIIGNVIGSDTEPPHEVRRAST